MHARVEGVRTLPAAPIATSPVTVLYEPVPDDAVLSHMTLAIGIVAQGGIVLVADGRTSRPELGTWVKDTDQKTKVHRFGHTAVALAGFVGMTEDVLARLRESEALSACRNIMDAKTIVAQVLRDETARFKGFEMQDWPSAAALVAGYEPDGVPHVYSLHTKNLFHPGRFHTIGSMRGGVVAEAIAQVLIGGWGGSPTLEAAVLCGTLAVMLVNEHDATVGPPTQLAIVRPDGTYEDASGRLPAFIDGATTSLPALRRAFAELAGR